MILIFLSFFSSRVIDSRKFQGSKLTKAFGGFKIISYVSFFMLFYLRVKSVKTDDGGQKTVYSNPH